MLLRELNEAREYRDLAPYALKSAESKGRAHPEDPDKFRPIYLRDRDRLIHSAAFRRLEFKTQVFVHKESDYYRTRLTHTLEVAQIARSVAYCLQLNEGFVEALALAHDLGHPPFGHAGESILDRLMTSRGGFEHNRQALRIVDLIETPYSHHKGLNLAYELRESLLKHGADGPADGLDLSAFLPRSQPFLEAQVVDLADQVAYTHHDLDDGLQASILGEEALQESTLWRRAGEAVSKRYPEGKGRVRHHQIINTLVKWIIADMTEHSHRILQSAGLGRAEDAQQLGRPLIRLSDEMNGLIGEVSRILDRHLYRNYEVARMVVRAERILEDLFSGYCRRPETLPPYFQDWAEQISVERAACDYVAGMTDRYAEEEWRRLRF